MARRTCDDRRRLRHHRRHPSRHCRRLAWRLAFRPFGHLAGWRDDWFDHRRLCWRCHPRWDHPDPEKSLAIRFRCNSKQSEARKSRWRGQESPPARFFFPSPSTILAKAPFATFQLDLYLLVLIRIGPSLHHFDSEKPLYVGAGLKCVVQRKIGENRGERLDRYNALMTKGLLCFKMGY